MDREPDELQFIGFYGVHKEAFKIIFSWPKIFTQITLAFILPLSFVSLAQLQISELISENFLYNRSTLYFMRMSRPMLNRISDWLSFHRITFWVFEAGSFLFALFLFLLSASAVVYAIACIYTAKDLTFAKVLSVVPKVWKRLTITYLWTFSFVCAYSFVVILALILIRVLFGNTSAGKLVFVFVFICYLLSFVYISFICHLASVVSVLEDINGIQAMIKSKQLIKGKTGVVSAIYISIQLPTAVIVYVFKSYVVNGLGMAWLSYGVGCFLVLTVLILLGLVVQTVVYFICKLHHHETIESLSHHLEVYSGDYVPLKGRDTQLEQFDI